MPDWVKILGILVIYYIKCPNDCFVIEKADYNSRPWRCNPLLLLCFIMRNAVMFRLIPSGQRYTKFFNLVVDCLSVNAEQTGCFSFVAVGLFQCSYYP